MPPCPPLTPPSHRQAWVVGDTAVPMCHALCGGQIGQDDNTHNTTGYPSCSPGCPSSPSRHTQIPSRGGGASMQIFMLLGRGRGLSFRGLQLHSSGNQQKLPLCSKGTNFGLRFNYSWYSSKTHDMRMHRLDLSCPSPTPPFTPYPPGDPYPQPIPAPLSHAQRWLPHH